MDARKQKILDFLKTQTLGVVSTIDANEDKPESAEVAFSETENLEVIFGTLNDARKFLNLKKNNRVAFVIGWDEVTVQYEGAAREITDAKELKECQERHVAKNPYSEKYVYDEREVFYKVTPKWIRYTDFSTEPEGGLRWSFSERNLL